MERSSDGRVFAITGTSGFQDRLLVYQGSALQKYVDLDFSASGERLLVSGDGMNAAIAAGASLTFLPIGP